jgi:hypothetical protein
MTGASPQEALRSDNHTCTQAAAPRALAVRAWSEFMAENDWTEGDAVPSGHYPSGGKWAWAAGVSVACIPLIAIAPQSWKVPLSVASMAFLAMSLILLGTAEVRERRGRKAAPKPPLQEAA